MLHCSFFAVKKTEELTTNEFMEVNKNSSRIKSAKRKCQLKKHTNYKFEETIKFQAVGHLATLEWLPFLFSITQRLRMLFLRYILLQVLAIFWKDYLVMPQKLE